MLGLQEGDSMFMPDFEECVTAVAKRVVYAYACNPRKGTDGGIKDQAVAVFRNDEEGDETLIVFMQAIIVKHDHPNLPRRRK